MSVVLTWKDVNFGESVHSIYRSTSTIDPMSLPTALATLGANVESYEDTTVVSGTTYYYRISATVDGVEYVSDELEISAVSLYPTDNLIGDYTFSSLSGGVVADASPSGEDLTVTGATLGTKGTVTDALVFDGNSDTAEATPASTYNIDAFAILVYPDNGIYPGNSAECVFEGDSSPEQKWLTFGSLTNLGINETICISSGNSSGTYGRTYITDQFAAGWYSIIFNWNTSTSSYDIYVDGVSYSTSAGTGSQGHAARYTGLDLVLFGEIYNGAFDFNGGMKAALIYDAPLTPTEISNVNAYLQSLIP
jgi:hypothetical protein